MSKIVQKVRAGLVAPPPNALDFLLLGLATLMLLRSDIAGLLFTIFVAVTRVGIILSAPRVQNVTIHNLIADPIKEPSRQDLDGR